MMKKPLTSCGDAPGAPTEKCTPSESYVGFPREVKELASPFVKSMLIDLPSAVFAGHPARGLSVYGKRSHSIDTHLRITGCKN